jgi:hypothetical protein
MPINRYYPQKTGCISAMQPVKKICINNENFLFHYHFLPIHHIDAWLQACNGIDALVQQWHSAQTSLSIENADLHSGRGADDQLSILFIQQQGRGRRDRNHTVTRFLHIELDAVVLTARRRIIHAAVIVKLRQSGYVSIAWQKSIVKRGVRQIVQNKRKGICITMVITASWVSTTP